MSHSESGIPRRRFFARTLAALAAGTWLGGEAREAGAQDSPYVGEIKMFAGDFAPLGWAFCDGQLLSTEDYGSLFNLIGTTYGGDGVISFALPDLRGRAPVHFGQGPGLQSWTEGQTGGAESVSMSVNAMPAHNHSAGASSTIGSSDNPAGMLPAIDAAGTPRFGATTGATLAAGAMASTGASAAHNNMQPYLTVNFIISLDGLFPTQ